MISGDRTQQVHWHHPYLQTHPDKTSNWICTKWSFSVRGSSCYVCSILAMPLKKPCVREVNLTVIEQGSHPCGRQNEYDSEYGITIFDPDLMGRTVSVMSPCCALSYSWYQSWLTMCCCRWCKTRSAKQKTFARTCQLNEWSSRDATYCSTLIRLSSDRVLDCNVDHSHYVLRQTNYKKISLCCLKKCHVANVSLL